MSASFNTPYTEKIGFRESTLATRQKDYYESIITHVNSGGTITHEVYESLAFAHQYHFNRHINYTGTKIVG